MILTLAPFIIFDMPGLTDYPNHLARMHLLTDGLQHPAARFYDIAWFLTPNLGMDIVVPTMGRFLGAETATRIFLVASMMLIMTGSAAIEVAVKKRISPASLVAPLFAYNSAFLLGIPELHVQLRVGALGYRHLDRTAQFKFSGAGTSAHHLPAGTLHQPSPRPCDLFGCRRRLRTVVFDFNAAAPRGYPCQLHPPRGCRPAGPRGHGIGR